MLSGPEKKQSQSQRNRKAETTRKQIVEIRKESTLSTQKMPCLNSILIKRTVEVGDYAKVNALSVSFLPP